MSVRSLRREVRNPILALPDDQRVLLSALLEDLARDAGARAQDSWARHKAPMAAYWRACSFYARHLARLLRPLRRRLSSRVGGADHVPR